MKINKDFKITYPSSEKVYVKGKFLTLLFPCENSLTDTVEIVDNKRKHYPNDPIYVYDTSGVLQTTRWS